MSEMSKSNGKEKKPDARKISKKLKPKQRKLIAHYTDHTNKETFGNGRKSAIAARYSERSATEIAYETLRNPHVERELTRILDAAGVTTEKLAKRVNQALNAKERKAFLHQASGNVVYSEKMVSHDIRLKAIRLAAELRGDFAPKQVNVEITLLASRIQAARRREAERVVQGEVVVEGDKNRPEADNLGGAPQAEEKTKQGQLSE